MGRVQEFESPNADYPPLTRHLDSQPHELIRALWRIWNSGAPNVSDHYNLDHELECRIAQSETHVMPRHFILALTGTLLELRILAVCLLG